MQYGKTYEQIGKKIFIETIFHLLYLSLSFIFSKLEPSIKHKFNFDNVSTKKSY